MTIRSTSAASMRARAPWVRARQVPVTSRGCAPALGSSIFHCTGSKAPVTLPAGSSMTLSVSSLPGTYLPTRSRSWKLPRFFAAWGADQEAHERAGLGDLAHLRERAPGEVLTLASVTEYIHLGQLAIESSETPASGPGLRGHAALKMELAIRLRSLVPAKPRESRQNEPRGRHVPPMVPSRRLFLTEVPPCGIRINLRRSRRACLPARTNGSR